MVMDREDKLRCAVRLAQTYYGPDGTGMFTTSSFQTAYGDEFECDPGKRLDRKEAVSVLESLSFVRKMGGSLWQAFNDDKALSEMGKKSA
jgi:hypothetical protein